MKKHLTLFLLLLLGSHSSFAWLGYLNGRLDHVLYDAYDPKTVVRVVIEKKEMPEAPKKEEIDFGGPTRTITGFRVKNVIMGKDSLLGTLITMETTSFIWPDELVSYTEKTECILVLNRSYGAKDYRIEAVVPSLHQEFKKVNTNREAVAVLEAEILEVLKQEKKSVRQCALIQQVAPVLQRSHAPELATYATSTNAWVSRTALAAIAYATEDERIIRILAADIEQFFSTHKENETITDIKGIPGYAPYPYYYQHVFFIEGRSMRSGSRWDEKEADRNQRLFHQLVKTGLISKKVQAILEQK